MCASKELAEIICTDSDHHWQTNRRPDRITTADPIPETKDALFADTECGNLIKRGRDGSKMCANGIFAQRICNPFACSLRVGHGLDGGEGLRRDDDQRRCRIKHIERVGNMRAIDVRHIMCAWAIMVRRKRNRRHDRTKIGATDTNIDDVGDLLACRTLDGAGADAIGEGSHTVEHFLHIRKDVVAIDQHFFRRGVAKGHMQNSAIFGVVDVLTCKHCSTTAFNIGRLSKFSQKCNRLIIDAGLRPVKQQIVKRQRIALKTARIGFECGTHVFWCRFRPMFLQLCDRCFKLRRVSCHDGTPSQSNRFNCG